MMQINHDTQELKIIKQRDRQWIGAVEKMVTESPIPIASVVINTGIYEDMRFEINQIKETALSQHGLVQEILEDDSQLIHTLTVNYQIRGNPNLVVTRHNGEIYDRARIRFNSVEVSPHQVAQSIAHMKKLFRVVDLETFCVDGDGQIERLHQLREADVVDLRGTYQSMLDRLQRDWQHMRDEHAAEVRASKEELKKDHEERATKLQASIDDQQQELDAERAKLQARVKDVDNRESKFARRDIYKELRGKIGDRYQKFELTAGTQKLRTPINVAVIVVLILFGMGFAALTVVPFFKTVDSPTYWLVKTGIFGLLFGSTLIYYFRWHSVWFKRHADEEFRLKKFDLDMERASWVVEMMIEWGIEKGVPMPDVLLDRFDAQPIHGHHHFGKRSAPG